MRRVDNWYISRHSKYFAYHYIQNDKFIKNMVSKTFAGVYHDYEIYYFQNYWEYANMISTKPRRNQT